METVTVRRSGGKDLCELENPIAYLLVIISLYVSEDCSYSCLADTWLL